MLSAGSHDEHVLDVCAQLYLGSHNVLELNAGVLRSLISMPDAIAAMHSGFLLLASGGIEQPQRIASDDARRLVMMAKAVATNDTIVKAVSIQPSNKARNLPTIHSSLLWIEGDTGIPSALLDGSTVTAFRTGAASGLATDLFADPEARRLTVFGAGGQAPDQIRAVCAVRCIDQVDIITRNLESAISLVERMAVEFPNVAFRASSDAHSSAVSADVICCATTSAEPVLTERDLKSNVHINAIGSYTLTMRELAPEVIAGAQVVCVDQLSASLAEAGEIVDAIERGLISRGSLVELGTLLRDFPVSGMRGRLHRPHSRSIFKSVGLAAQDWAFAALVMERLKLQPAPVTLG